MKPNKPKCSIEMCEEPSRCKGLCGRHYNQARRSSGAPCEVDGCDRPREGRGWCGMHYQRWLAKGDTGPAGTVRLTNEGAVCPGPECGEPAFSRGYCSAHYQMVLNGQELRPVNKRISATMGMSLTEKLAYYTLPKDEDGCRKWNGPMGPRGYPAMSMDGMKTRLVHRAVYMIANGETISSAIPVHHACGVRNCVEPSHLQAVKPEENTAEMLERRYYRKRIEILEHALSVLDPEHPILTGSK